MLVHRSSHAASPFLSCRAGLALCLCLLTPLARSGEKAVDPAPKAAASSPSARDLIFAAHAGVEPIDEQIRRLQERARSQPAPAPAILQLGHLFISKARLTNDPGFYRLAEQCAVAVEANAPDQPDALLLRGHCLAAMHRFKDAEALARKLTGLRENVLDYGLLGDALMEQGKLAPAIEAYQKMADLKPSMPVYARVAHIRWLKGDLPGAVEAIEESIQSSNPRDMEPLAWATNRLARYRWQEGNEQAALEGVTRALALVPNYAPALLTQGQIYLGQQRFTEAIPPLQTAAKAHPLPEYRWALAEALRAAGRAPEAEEVERQLHASGAADDPRTYALYLATTGEHAEKALQLAAAELGSRQDIFSHDAHAWSLRAAGNTTEAVAAIERALTEGAADARLSLHAGVIFSEAAELPRALEHFDRAEALRRMLHPTERQLLSEKRAAALARQSP